MFMEKPGTVFLPLVLGFMARTAGASDIRFLHEGAALLSVGHDGVFWERAGGRSSLKKTGGLLKPKFSLELCCHKKAPSMRDRETCLS